MKNVCEVVIFPNELTRTTKDKQPTLLDTKDSKSIFALFWNDETNCDVELKTRASIINRLSSTCTLAPERFELLLPMYLQKKYHEAEVAKNPYTIHADLFKLFKASTCASHESFADAINQSNVLSSYCSKDYLDKQLGACGSWQEMEDETEGGVGNPPFSEKVLTDIVSRVGNGITIG